MREIKFRAWSKKGGLLRKVFGLFGLLNSYDGGYHYCPDDGNCHLGSFPEKEDVVLMQFTGLKDKNGKDIYEGDIIQHQGSLVLKRTVKWNENEAKWDIPATAFIEARAGNPWLVIGNIHENPELLEK